jgi:hypothetical protein
MCICGFGFEVIAVAFMLGIIYIMMPGLFCRLKLGGDPGVIFKTHPNMNKELFANENILGLRDPSRPFPTGQTGDAGVGLLKWRMQSADESMVPLTSGYKSEAAAYLSTVHFLLYVLMLCLIYAYCSQLLAICFWKRNICQHRV